MYWVAPTAERAKELSVRAVDRASVPACGFAGRPWRKGQYAWLCVEMGARVLEAGHGVLLRGGFGNAMR